MKSMTACAPIPITALPGGSRRAGAPSDYIFASEEFEILSSRSPPFPWTGNIPRTFRLIADLVLKGDAE